MSFITNIMKSMRYNNQDDDYDLDDDYGFADDYDEENLKFEPGVSTDIGFVTLVAVKIIYDLLNIGTEGYTQRVINYLTNYTWVCNTNNPSIGGRLAGIFDHPLYITNNVRFSCMAKTAGKESA